MSVCVSVCVGVSVCRCVYVCASELLRANPSIISVGPII